MRAVTLVGLNSFVDLLSVRNQNDPLLQENFSADFVWCCFVGKFAKKVRRLMF